MTGFNGSNMYITYVRFRETGLEPANREEVMSEKAKTRSRNLVYLCWRLVWIGVWFRNITFEDTFEVDIPEIKRLLEDEEPTNE